MCTSCLAAAGKEVDMLIVYHVIFKEISVRVEIRIEKVMNLV